MKRVLLAVFAAVAAFACAGCDYYITGDRDYSSVTFPAVSVSGESILSDVKRFVYGDGDIAIAEGMSADESVLNRTAFTAGPDGDATRGERAAAKRLEDLFVEIGYAARVGEDRVEGPFVETRRFETTLRYSDGWFGSESVKLSSQNVVATLPATGESLGTVIVGTHYDNSFGSEYFEGEGGHGVYSGGMSVGVLTEIARRALDTPRPYELVFAAFGAGEPGNFGSSAFVEEMSVAERESVLLMIDLDLIGGGDDLYLFCDDAETAHEDYLRVAANRVRTFPVSAPPKDKRVILSNGSTETYTHYGYFWDNNSFLKAGINSAALFGLNWNLKHTYGIAESASVPAMLGTKDDTLYTLSMRYPDYSEKSRAAAEFVLSVLNADPAEFAEVMRFSHRTRRSLNWLTSTRVQMYIYGGSVLLTGIAAAVTAYVLMKRKPRPEDLVQPPEEVFDSNAGGGDDPFGGY